MKNWSWTSGNSLIFSFKLAKDIDGQLKQMVQDLKSIIDHLNTANTQQQDNEDPVRTLITLDMLQWYQSKEQCSEFGIWFFLFQVISIQFVSIRPEALRLHENFDHFKYSLHIWGEYSSFFKPSAWNFLHLDWINLYRNYLYWNDFVRKRPVTPNLRPVGDGKIAPPAPKREDKINSLHQDLIEGRGHWDVHVPGVIATCGDEQWKCFIKETIQLSHHQCNLFF